MLTTLKKFILTIASILFLGGISQASVTFTIVQSPTDSVDLLLTGILQQGPDMGDFATIQTSNFGTNITTVASGSLLYNPPNTLSEIGRTDAPGSLPIEIIGGGNGLQSLTFDATGFNIQALAIVASAGFILVDFTSMDPFTGEGTVCTNGNCSIGGDALPAIFTGGGQAFDNPFTGLNNPGISHVTFYGGRTVSTIPEPATWLMMILGFAVTAALYRRRLSVA